MQNGSRRRTWPADCGRQGAVRHEHVGGLLSPSWWRLLQSVSSTAELTEQEVLQSCVTAERRSNQLAWGQPVEYQENVSSDDRGEEKKEEEISQPVRAKKPSVAKKSKHSSSLRSSVVRRVVDEKSTLTMK